jgi:hypothetical protein
MNTNLGGVDGIDLDALAADLRGAGAIHNDAVRRSEISRISAAALVDIAGSLRVLAAEASLAMLGVDTLAIDDDEAEDPVDDATRDFFVVGDRVRLRDDRGTTGTIVALGTSEGSVIADVIRDELDNGPDVMRYFGEYLERIVRAESVEAGDPIDESDDPEDDFTPPANALDALRDLEKKPAKKKGKKS